MGLLAAVAISLSNAKRVFCNRGISFLSKNASEIFLRTRPRRMKANPSTYLQKEGMPRTSCCVQRGRRCERSNLGGAGLAPEVATVCSAFFVSSAE